jgi:hypothetical protein
MKIRAFFDWIARKAPHLTKEGRQPLRLTEWFSRTRSRQRSKHSNNNGKGSVILHAYTQGACVHGIKVIQNFQTAYFVRVCRKESRRQANFRPINRISFPPILSNGFSVENRRAVNFC